MYTFTLESELLLMDSSPKNYFNPPLKFAVRVFQPHIFFPHKNVYVKFDWNEIHIDVWLYTDLIIATLK